MKKQIRFISDRYQLYGILHLPADKNPPVVIGSHGLMSTGDSLKQIALAEKCNAYGIAFFRFDHRGCGRSSGEFASATTFNGRCRDLENAIKTIQAEIGEKSPFGLFGSSYGGAISLAVAGKFDIRALVTVAAPIRSDDINPPYINDPANTNLIEALDKDKLKFDVTGRLAGVSNLLLFHGEADEIVPISNALEIYERAKAPKQLIRLKNGDHQISHPAHQQEFIDRAASWYALGLKHKHYQLTV